MIKIVLGILSFYYSHYSCDYILSKTNGLFREERCYCNKNCDDADVIKNEINIHQQSAKLIIVSKILYILSMKVKTSFSNKATAHQ